jgi:hypothetical protein
LEQGDRFAGFAMAASVPSDAFCQVRTRGQVVLSVAGVSGGADFNRLVFAFDDDTFSLTANASPVGRVMRHVTGTFAVVQFDAAGPEQLSASEAATVRAWALEPVVDATSRAITAADNGRRLAPAAGITYTIPAGLSPKPAFSVQCPPSGTVTIAVSGGATINGAGTALTRARTSNRVGFVVEPYTDAGDAYGVSGA